MPKRRINESTSEQECVENTADSENSCFISGKKLLIEKKIQIDTNKDNTGSITYGYHQGLEAIFIKSEVTSDSEETNAPIEVICTDVREISDEHENHKTNKHFIHVDTILNSHQSIINCDECDFQTETEEKLQKHKLVKHLISKLVEPNDKDFNCPICQQKYKKEHELNQHMQVHLSNGHLYSCQKCHYKTNYLANLKRHERLCTIKIIC